MYMKTRAFAAKVSELWRYLQFVWHVFACACVLVLLLKTQALSIKTQTHACTHNMFACGGVYVSADMCVVCTLAHALRRSTSSHV